ncbi:MAG: twin-arginine translocation signal domain-containing protein [Thermoguttaceae bacterium]|nr:twin-arginine translocation signal domain-containing protein [Thermoguttaceae bacterium]
MMSTNQLSRRQFVQTATAASVAACLGTMTQRTMAKAVYENRLIDRLWVWAHQVNAYKNAFGLPGNTKFQPIDGVRYLGVPNVIMVGYNDIPTPPFDDYYHKQHFDELKRIYWSFVGASGRTSQAERLAVLDLVARYPNVKGVFMDDLFRGHPKKDATEMPASCTLAELELVKKSLGQTGKQPDLGVTLYTTNLVPLIKKHLDYCDVVSFWTWKAVDLKRLEENFEKYRAIVPGKRTLLGIYMWDFGMNKPMPMDMMELQCELGRQWLRQGKIEGMIFLATNVCDLGLETVTWSKEWIAKHANECW